MAERDPWDVSEVLSEESPAPETTASADDEWGVAEVVEQQPTEQPGILDVAMSDEVLSVVAPKIGRAKKWLTEGKDTWLDTLRKSTQAAGHGIAAAHGGIEQQAAISRGTRSFPISPEYALEHAREMGLVGKDEEFDLSQGAIDNPRLLDALIKSADDLERQEQGAIRKDPLFEQGTERAGYHGERIRELQPDVPPGSAKYYVGQAIQSFFSSVLPAMGASIATGGAALPGLALMGTQVYGQRLGEQLEKGRDMDMAQVDAMFYTLSETIPETIPLGIALKRGTPFLKRLFGTVGAEGGQEMITEVLQAGYDAGVLDENMTLQDALRRVVDAGIVGGLMGGGMATVGGAYDRAAGISRESPTSPTVIKSPSETPEAASDPWGVVEVAPGERIEPTMGLEPAPAPQVPTVSQEAPAQPLTQEPSVEAAPVLQKAESVIQPEPEAVPAIPTEIIPREKPSDVRPTKNALLDLIASSGGISREEAEAQGIDPAYFKQFKGKKPLFPKAGGMTFDQAAELVSQYGYGSEQYSANEMLDMLERSLRGETILPARATVSEKDIAAAAGLEHYLDAQEAAQAQELVRQARSLKPVTESDLGAATAEMPDYSDDDLIAGQRFEEQEYDPAMGGEARALLELHQDAKQYDEIRADGILESQKPPSEIARGLFQIIQEGKKRGRPAAEPRAPEGAQEQGPATQAPAVEPRAAEPPAPEEGFRLEPQQVRPAAPAAAPAPDTGDLFGVAPSPTQQAINRAREEREPTGPYVPPSSGPGELFAGPRPEQLDITRPERRRDTEQRKHVAEMSPDEMRRALLLDDLTGLPNRRAYEESQKKAVQVFLDMDSLKWINDNLGHDSGDQILRTFGEILRTAAGNDAYHLSGDEFIIQADTVEAADAIMQAANEIAAAVTLEFQTPDGKRINLIGLGFSYGYGEPYNGKEGPAYRIAEAQAARNKTERENLGLRAKRGEPPVQVSEKPAVRDQAVTRTPAEEEAPAEPAEVGRGIARTGLYVEFNGQRYPVDSFKDASEKWDKFRETSMAGASEIGEGVKIYDQDGNEVAEVAYNGRVFPPGGWKSGVVPLYEPARRTKEEKWGPPISRDEWETPSVAVDTKTGKVTVGMGAAEIVDEAAHEAATSPQNKLPEPTEAQKEAGNYQKGHITLRGLDISIENPAGTRRRPEWPPLKHHYGYIKGTVGKDKDHIDVFLGPTAHVEQQPIYVVDQINPETSAFDEHKVMIGFDSLEDARHGYLDNYAKDWKGLGNITETSLGKFKDWLDDGDTTKPFAPLTTKEAPKATKPAEGDHEQQKFKEGERVVVKDYRDEEMKGRHGVVVEAQRIGWRTVNLFGGGPETSSSRYTYRIKTDGGVEVTADAKDIEAETGEAPKAVPDIVLGNYSYTPKHVLNIIDLRKKSAAGAEAAAERARKQDRIQELKKKAADYRTESAKAQAAYNRWAEQYPEEASKISGKQERTQAAHNWWKNELTNAGRERAAESAGVQKNYAGYHFTNLPDDVSVKLIELHQSGWKPDTTAAPGAAPVTTGEIDAVATLKAAGLTVRKTKTNKGSDVWEVSGDTRTHKDLIKSLGGRWYGPKKVWSFYKGDPSEKLSARLPKPAGYQAPTTPVDEETVGSTITREEPTDVNAERPRLPETRDDQADREARTDRGEDRGPVGERVEEADLGTGEERPAAPEIEGTGGEGGGRVDERAGGGREQPPGGPRDTGDVRTEPERGAITEQPTIPGTPRARTATPSKEGVAVSGRHDYTITDADELGAGGLKTKYKNNVAAIRTLKQIEEEDRLATPDEQKVLAKYIGWGGIKGAFDPDNKDWSKEYAELKELLTPEEYEAARRSILDAHYTSVPIVRGIWAALDRMGFRSGRVLEPSVGVGNFLGLMPKSMRAKSDFFAVELDRITGAIARQLYQHADIASPRGFQDVILPTDSFDVVVGNPPFGNQKLYDANHPEFKNFSIHNYFIAKSIDKLRPGGILSVVVSRYFMDTHEAGARSWIAGHAKLIGAIRLPYTAFKDNANTEVVTDIIVLQKLKEGETADKSWVNTGDLDVAGTPARVNRYFIDNPFMVLGQFARTGSMYAKDELTVEPPTGETIEAGINRLVGTLPENIFAPTGRSVEELTAVEGMVPEHVKVDAYFVTEDGKLARRAVDSSRTDEQGQPVKRYQVVAEMRKATEERIRGMITVRDALRNLMRSEMTQQTDTDDLKSLRSKLNRVYDAFQRKNGYINSLGNRRAFQDDPDLPLLESLEPGYDPGVSRATAKSKGLEQRPPKAEKAAIFTKRVLAPFTHVTKADNPKDSLMASLNERGLVDLEYMSEITGTDKETLTKELAGLVYLNPETEVWEVADEYQTGNVKAKLYAAREAAKTDPRYADNVLALEKVQPPFVNANDISVRLGSTWVPPEIVTAFGKELLGVTPSVGLIKAVGKWSFKAKGEGTAFTATWGTRRMPADEIIESLLNLRAIVIKDNHGTSHEPQWVVNDQETSAARAKAEDVQQKFKDWIWLDQARRERLEKIYNDVYNTNRARQFDGEHMTLPGMSPAINLRQHQKAAIWRIIQDRIALLDHVVGAGKTFEMVGAAMELRRMGLARKPIFTVPNHLVVQWRDEFYKLYPNANILATREKDFTKGNRERLFSRIATGDWDAVIVAHSSFKKIGMPAEEEQRILTEMARELTDAIEEMKRERGDRHIIRDMERIKERLTEKVKSLNAKGGEKDKAVAFDELGVDALFVDEAHMFKNLFYFSQMQGVTGLGNPTGSGRAFDMFVKTRYLQNRYGGKGITVFATGTPVSNSLVEMFTMQRYLIYDDLKSRGIHLLDSWARVFGDVQNVYEVHPSGNGYRLSNRFAKFVNMPELMTLYRKFSDVITMDDLKAQAKAAGKRFPVPKMKGGKPQLVVAERSPQQVRFFGVPEFRRGMDGGVAFKHDALEVQDKEGKFFVIGDHDSQVAGPFENRQDAEQERERLLDEYDVQYNEGSILWKFENLRRLTKDSDGKINALSITNEARKAGLDFRLIDPNAPDFPGSKLNTAVDNILNVYQEWNGDKGTQLVFCDLSVPKAARDKVLAQAKKQAEKEQAEALESEGAESETAEEESTPIEEEEKISMDQLLATQSTFSVYDDVKQKLIAKGIPVNHIAFIHEYDTADKKNKLFQAVRDGHIRVLLGSTEKMGAGMNVQDRLVAVHHLDAPWRPSDLEQRNGRIIRQGNKLYERDPDGFEVQEFRYATKQTYDTRMWQIIEHKARGVEQLRKADETARTIEDISGEAASAADMKAAASGNPLILDEIKLRNEIRSLEAQEQNYLRTLFDLQKKIQTLEKADDRYAARTADIKRWIAVRDKNPSDPFKVEIGGKTFTERKNIAGPVSERMVEAYKNPARSLVPAGIYRGVHFGFQILADDKTMAAKISLDGKEWLHHSSYGKGDDFSPSGFLTRIDNSLERLDKDIDQAKQQLEQDKAEMTKARAEVGKPFPKKQTLDETRVKHREVVQKLQKAGGAAELSPEMKRELHAAMVKRRAAQGREAPPEPKFARTKTPTAGIDQFAIEEHIAPILNRLKTKVPVTVVESYEDLPPAVYDRIREEGVDVQGVAYDGRVYLVASQIPTLDVAERVLLDHELRHIGLRELLGRDLGPVLTKAFYGREHAKIMQFARERNLRTESRTNTMTAAEEYIVNLAETRQENTLLQKVYAAIRDFLRRMGFKIELADIDLRDIVARAGSLIERGNRSVPKGAVTLSQTTEPATEQPMFARRPSGVQLQGLKDGKIKAVATPNPDGSWEVYIGHGPYLIGSQGMRRQKVGGSKEATKVMEAAGLTVRIPPASGSRGPTTPPLFKGFDVPTENVRNYLLRKLQDRFRRVKVIQHAVTESGGKIDEQSDAYLTEELFYGKTEERIREFHEKFVDPLIQDIRKHGLKIEDVDLYLYAKHAPERNAHIAEINPYFRDNDIPGSGMSDEEARKILDDFEAKGMTKKLEDISGWIRYINRERLNLLEREGLESSETLDLWRKPYKHYVPLRGFSDTEEGDVIPRIGRGFDIRGKESKRAMGRSSLATSPLTYTIVQMEESLIRAEKNKVGKSFLKLVEANPNPELWEINKAEFKPRYDTKTGEVVYDIDPKWKLADNVLSVKVDGEQTLITIHDDVLAHTMKSMGAEHSNQVVQVLASVNRFLAAVNTSLNPEFVLSNFTRDLQTAIINLYGEQGAKGGLGEPKGIARKVLKDLPLAISGVYAGVRGVDKAVFGLAGRSEKVQEWAKWYDEYRKAGGKIGFYGLVNIETRRKQLHRAIKLAHGGSAAQAERVIRATGDLIFDINSAVENGVRLATYKNARELGLSKSKAASLARNISTNFNRKGELGAIANSLYLFYNASVQGSMRILYALRSRRVQAVMLGIVGAAYLLAEMNRLVGGDDDDDENFYDKIMKNEPWLAEHNIIIMRNDGEGGYLKIPLPYGYNIPHVLGTYLSHITHSGNPQKAATRMFLATMNSFNPLGSDADLIQMISPTILDPLVQVETNKNFYGAPISPEQRGYGPKRPDSQLAWNSVTPASKAIAQKLNELTGGSEVRPGGIDISPGSIDYMISQLTGGAGAFVNRSLNYVALLSGGKEVPVKMIPFVRRFVGEQSEFYVTREFFDNLNEVYYAHDEMESLRKSGRYQEAQEKIKELQPLLQIYNPTRNLDERLQRNRKKIRDIRGTPYLSDDEKEKRVDIIRHGMEREMKLFNKEFKKAVNQ